MKWFPLLELSTIKVSVTGWIALECSARPFNKGVHFKGVLISVLSVPNKSYHTAEYDRCPIFGNVLG